MPLGTEPPCLQSWSGLAERAAPVPDWLTSCLRLDTALCLAPCFTGDPAPPFHSRKLSLPHQLVHLQGSPGGRSWDISSPTGWMDPEGEGCPGRLAALAQRDQPATRTGSLLGPVIPPAKTPHQWD
uniref:Uncharacterized protein n=1 Tax=Calidris pygmaea TaxID=425635 RepID=A0A8C3JQT8_9CHAR